MLFILFVLVIYLLISHFSLRNRVTDLEQKLRVSFLTSKSQSQSVEPAQPIPPAPASDFKEMPAEQPVPLPPEPVPDLQHTPQQWEPAPAGPKQEFFIYTWFKEQTLIKVGAIIFFLGAIWFVSYAIEQGWISPLTRIMLGVLLAVAVYATGYLRRAITTQYQVLTTLGTGVLLGTVIASQFAFTTAILPPAIAFLLMLVGVGYTLLVALITKTEWLGVVAAIAGLCVPLLVDMPEPQPLLLLIYLFLLSASFLTAVFLSSWRIITTTLLIGSVFHLASVYDSGLLPHYTVWFFVIIFSALFCASATISIARTDSPTIADVSVLGISTLQFIGYAVAIAIWPELALFVAAAATAFIGYLLRLRGSQADSVSIFVAISLINILVGTAVMFDGFVLTIAYAIEVLAVYLLSMKLATVERSVYVAAGLFVIPLLSGLANLKDLAYKDGILHAETLGVLSVLGALGLAVVWTLRNQTLQAVDWLRDTAGTMLFVWYGFAVVSSVVFATVLKSTLVDVFTSTLLLTGLSVLVVLYVFFVIPRQSWRVGILLTLTAPAASALIALGHPDWHNGISHQPFAAALIFFIVTIILTTLYWLVSRKNMESGLANAAYGLVWLVLGYGIIFITTVWNSLLSGDLERVTIGISYLFLIYLIINCMLMVRLNASRVVALVMVLILPALHLLPSLTFYGWQKGLMSIDAVGLYITTVVMFLLATTMRQHTDRVEGEDKDVFMITSNTLYVIGGLLTFALTWIMSQTAFTSEGVAVTVALFIYTIAGLASYSFGRVNENTTWKRVGILLLSAVILRLALVDFWVMERLWQVVTFLGIGTLFIGTALLEKSKYKDGPKKEPSQE